MILAKVTTPSDTVSAVTARSLTLSKYSTAVADQPTASIVRTEMFSSPVLERRSDTGSHILEGLRIFKHGTFKDSLGLERTWEPLHLDEMAMYFRHLRESGIFPNVPVRTDHSFSVKDVVGYIQDIYRDKEDDSYLSVDLEFTEPEAYEKWKRGTYRSRSLEVGMYETNDGATYYPVVMGLAFVDIPAVEGLHGKAHSAHSIHFSQVKDLDKENRMNLEQFLAACRYAQWEIDCNYAKAVADWEAAANYAAALEQHAEFSRQLGITNAPPAPQSATGNLQFRVGDQVVTDPAQVQRELDTLSAFQRETVKVNRETFVDSLAHSNKILANQVEQFKGLVQTMTPEQFKMFQDSYAGEGSVGLLNNYGSQDGGTPPVKQPEQGVEHYSAIVQRLRDSGMPEEKVQKTEAYAKLQSLQASQANG